MKKPVTVSLLAIFLSGCSAAPYSHQPGGPYYFKSVDMFRYREHRPSGEITKAEAEELDERGSAYYMAYFSSSGKPVRILKVHEGQAVLDQEIKYDADGEEVGVGPNRAEEEVD